MTSFRLRPRFKFHSRHSCDEIKERIEAKLSGNEENDCFAEYSNHHIFLKISPKEQHYWSPQLDLTCESQDAGGTMIKGLYGPHPHVWTFFMFSYLGLATIATFVGLIGLARMSLGLSSWILWIVPGLGFLGLILYISSQMGQKVGVEQTFILHHFLEDILDERVHVN